MIMLRVSILILTLVRLSLVEGVETSKPAENETEITTESLRRILYGTRVRGAVLPYLVRLRLSEPKSRLSMCVGSIIANHWILTAAHCIRGQTCRRVRILPAAWRNPGALYPAQCYSHEQYQVSNYEYDIGLMRLGQDILKDGRAKIVKLPPPGKVYPRGTSITIAGWGITEENELSSTLLRATVRVDKWETCNRKFLEHDGPRSRGIPKRILCVQGEGRTPSGLCFGDSGGPAVTRDGFVIGVGSFVLTVGERCMIGGPSMFVNVADYLPWIYRHIDPSKDTRNFPVGPEHILT